LTEVLTLIEGAPAVRWTGRPAGLAQLPRAGRRWRRALRLGEDPFVVSGQDVAARGVTGVIRVGATLVQVQPKWLEQADDDRWLAALWQILMVVDPHARVRGAVGSAAVKDGQVDLLARMFLRALGLVTLTGLPRGYVERRETVPYLRGSLDQGRLGALLVDPFALPCVFDRHEEDIPLNRLLRWAAETLVGLVRSPRLAAELQELTGLFSAVSAHPPSPAEADRIVVPAVYRHLEPAVRLARILLAQSRLVHGAEDELAAGFLWKSHAVFEDIVAHLMRVAAPQLGVSVEGSQQLLAERGGPWPALRTRPDVRLVREDRTQLVLDAKYKLLAKGGGPKPDDVYQVLTGAALNDTPDAVLVYPAQGAGTAPVTFATQLATPSPARLSLVFVDLLKMAEPDGETALAAELMEILRPMVDEADARREEAAEAEREAAIRTKLQWTEAAAAMMPLTTKRLVERDLSATLIPAAWARLTAVERRLLMTPFVLERSLQAAEQEARERDAQASMDWSGLVLGPLAALESVLLRTLVVPCRDDAPDAYAGIARGPLSLGKAWKLLAEANAPTEKGALLRRYLTDRADLDHALLLDPDAVVDLVEEAKDRRNDAAHAEDVARDGWAWVIAHVVGDGADSGLLSRVVLAQAAAADASDGASSAAAPSAH
jgi:5-methylcytosine-specific restriction enzyme subunit McrC